MGFTRVLLPKAAFQAPRAGSLSGAPLHRQAGWSSTRGSGPACLDLFTHTPGWLWGQKKCHWLGCRRGVQSLLCSSLTL